MKVASILLAAALLPAAAAAQAAPSSVTITSTLYCTNGRCHAPQYDLLEQAAIAARDHRQLDGMKIAGSIADDNATHTLSIDGQLRPPHHPMGGPPQGAAPPAGPPQGAPPQGGPPTLTVHAQATYRGMTLIRATGETRDANGNVVERWTIST